MSIEENIVIAFNAMSLWELVAVGLGLLYLILVMKQNNFAWYCAFFSTGIFIFLFWNVNLLMESALSVYYLLMAIYGWWSWRQGVENQPRAIQTLSTKTHGLIFIFIVTVTLINGYLLSENTQAALPYLDSFTTWGAVVTTILVARKVLENWLYWIVIDSAACYMYLQRDLYLTAALMAVYLVLVVLGWLQWRQEYQVQNHVG